MVLLVNSALRLSRSSRVAEYNVLGAPEEIRLIDATQDNYPEENLTNRSVFVELDGTME